MTTPTSGTADPAHAAKTSYLNIRRRRQDLVQDLSSDVVAPETWADRAELAALRQDELRARREWLAHGPDTPTAWWPGGWRLRHPDGTVVSTGGVGNLGVWPTRRAAQGYLQAHIRADGTLPARVRDTRPEWCTTRDPHSLQNLTTVVIALDAEFWAHTEGASG